LWEHEDPFVATDQIAAVIVSRGEPPGLARSGRTLPGRSRTRFVTGNPGLADMRDALGTRPDVLQRLLQLTRKVADLR